MRRAFPSATIQAPRVAALKGEVGDALNPLRMMQRVVDEALSLVDNADGAAVELADPIAMTYVVASGRLAGSVGLRLSREASMSGAAVRARAVLRCDDSESDERVDRMACRQVGARSMICVPLLRADAAVGVLKVSSQSPSAFDDRDVATLRRLGEFVAFVIATAAEMTAVTDSTLESVDDTAASEQAAVSRFVANVLVPAAARDARARECIKSVIDDRQFYPVFQPIVELGTGATIAVEALTRFTHISPLEPGRWFADAAAVGLGVDLEIAAVGAALPHLAALPDRCSMAVNLGPDSIASPRLLPVLDDVDLSRLTIEITEHVAVGDYPELRRQLDAYRRRGALLAVDDTGAGFASFAHIVQLAPDIIKVDIDLTRGVDIDPVRRSLTAAVVTFAHDTGAQVIAEGIETDGELEALRTLGVSHGQGYLLGRPAPLHELELAH